MRVSLLPPFNIPGNVPLAAHDSARCWNCSSIFRPDSSLLKKWTLLMTRTRGLCRLAFMRRATFSSLLRADWVSGRSLVGRIFAREEDLKLTALNIQCGTAFTRVATLEKSRLLVFVILVVQSLAETESED